MKYLLIIIAAFGLTGCMNSLYVKTPICEIRIGAQSPNKLSAGKKDKAGWTTFEVETDRSSEPPPLQDEDGNLILPELPAIPPAE